MLAFSSGILNAFDIYYLPMGFGYSRFHLGWYIWEILAILEK